MAVMDEEKRNLIVKEIGAWRRNKLLPEQYCDFLQNIYLDDLNDRPKGILGNAVKKIGQASGKMWFIAFGIFSLICLVVLHFSAFPVSMQIGLSGVITAAFIGIGGKMRVENPLRGMSIIGTGMAFMAGVGFGILQLNGWAGNSGTMWLLGLCAAVWIGLGIYLRSALLHGFGWLAVVALYALLLSEHAPTPSLFGVQIYWIPASLLFLWLSWFLHVRHKSAGAVLFSTGLILWFMPEVYSALYGIHTEWIQAEILLKIVIAGVGMFRLRKQWMEWVA